MTAFLASCRREDEAGGKGLAWAGDAAGAREARVATTHLALWRQQQRAQVLWVVQVAQCLIQRCLRSAGLVCGRGADLDSAWGAGVGSSVGGRRGMAVDGRQAGRWARQVEREGEKPCCKSLHHLMFLHRR